MRVIKKMSQAKMMKVAENAESDEEMELIKNDFESDGGSEAETSEE